ncbi:lysophospholipid acyltransferase family protein [Pararhizobium haloflavum]|uniref:lysophospholipid acyltransferase family protein n=1 Tax=Pararhizobium haloflavum TaxID=2037914 RepID=UPI000C1A2727|nr:1-acyl-sn-glycerol-3-phosphate acyltransferase [Pararhizobium haloflavum]
MIGKLRICLAAAVFLLVTLVMLPVHLVALALDLPLARRLPHIWHRLMCPVLGLRVTACGELSTRRPLMLVANHASWLDIVALSAVAEVAFIAKAEVRDWPFFGWLARWQRSVFVDRDRRRSAGSQIAAIAERLDRGEIVVLFAEGTTSDGNRVLDFKSSLFGAARDAAGRSEHGEIILQTATIAYTRIHGLPMGRRHRTLATWPGDVDLLPHLLTVLREGAIDVDIHFGSPVPFSPESDRKTVTRGLHGEISRSLSDVLRKG